MVKRKFILLTSLLLMVLLISSGTALAQEVVANTTVSEVQMVAENTVVNEAQPAAEAKELTPEWLWGEVVSVNPQLGQFEVKHMDYDSYEEIKSTLTIDEKTMFENAQDISHVLVGDHVTVDYKKKALENIVELVVVEKPLPEKIDEAAAVVEPVKQEAQ